MTTIMIMAHVGSARKLGNSTPNTDTETPLIRPLGCSSIFHTSAFATTGVTTGMKKSTRNAARPLMRELSANASPRDTAMFAGTYRMVKTAELRSAGQKSGFLVNRLT